MNVNLTVNVNPFDVPAFLSEASPENSDKSSGSVSIEDISAESLDLLCIQFRKDVFEKADKVDPALVGIPGEP